MYDDAKSSSETAWISRAREHVTCATSKARGDSVAACSDPPALAWSVSSVRSSCSRHRSRARSSRGEASARAIGATTRAAPRRAARAARRGDRRAARRGDRPARATTTSTNACEARARARVTRSPRGALATTDTIRGSVARPSPSARRPRRLLLLLPTTVLPAPLHASSRTSASTSSSASS